jgi:cytochrome c-type biogenesis protein CcmH/NrfG
VARGTQHRKRRPTANARVAPAPTKGKAKTVKHQRWEDQLFFARLRVHAKWVFVFLAAVFAVGFVIFGVGSGSTGISDALQNFFQRNSASGSSASSLRKKAEQHPKQPKAWHDLATKLEADDKLDEAIDALKHYTALLPKNPDALTELASVYLRRAGEEQQIYLDANTRSQLLAPTPAQPSANSDLGKALASLSNPIQSAVSGVVGTGSSTAYSTLIQLETEAVGVYKKLAKLSPKDATTQLRLAQVAQGAGDSNTAIAAYEQFLKLSPDDPSAPAVRRQLKQLKAQAKASASTATKVTTHK